ncbi:MAG: hypothetical protein A3F67_08025 [Verrucomicrobia bacterium RIFCSPHIGHO2_12_FULL_41_10]|nr:MAG: hypothetical protein A3F67_08025 [Verrucomicrobia bacterium RIFCSPHIGHO2_12_FULL_41_10]
MSIPFNKSVELSNNVMIVDALGLAFRWKHSGAREFFQDYLNTVKSLQKSYKAKYVIIVSDKGKSRYRKAIYPEYKANREDKYKDQTETEKLAVELFFKDFEYALEYIAETTEFPVLRFDATEADDIAAYIVQKLQGFSNIEHTWLISTDADWDLLLSEKVSRFSYITRKEYTIANWNDNHDYAHEHHLSIKCLMGDTGDNVKGVEGVGPKRAIDLVNTYGSALDVVDALPIKSNLKYIQNLNQAADKILLNYQLMDLQSYSATALGPNSTIVDLAIERYIDG